MILGGIVDRVAPTEKGGAFLMLQIKTIIVKSIEDLDSSVNEFLSGIDSDSFRSIEVKEEKGLAFILYEVKEEWKERMCYECQHWDDGGSADSVSGLCHECGGRRRFNCNACDRFKDVRK